MPSSMLASGAREADAVPATVMTEASRPPLGGNSVLTWK